MVRYLIQFNYIMLSLMVGCESSSIQTYFKYKFPLDFKYWFSDLSSGRNPEVDVNPHKINNADVNAMLDDEINNDKIPELEDLVKKHGYPVEKYEVTTEDGYILTVFRVQHGKNGPDAEGTVRKPVMLQHGIMDSAAVYLAPRNGMAYFLADKGYDVWIGNSRGTKLSRGHVNKDKDPKNKGTTYWDFSFHEMGVYDLPAVFDKIQENTGNQKIHFVGMSMGSTQFLVMGSECPKYLKMIDCVILMAPVARPVHMNLASGFAFYLSWTVFTTWRGIKPDVGIKRGMATSAYKFCKTKGLKGEICKKIMKNLQKPKKGENLYDFENTVDVYPFSPASVSANCFIHFLQIVNEGKFQMFDYGNKVNEIKYKQQKPLEYNLENIQHKLYLLVGGNDDIADERDVLWLHGKLPSSEVISDKFKSFTHRDFHHSVNIEENLYTTILQIFTDWESKAKDDSS